jgi:cytochrome b
MDTAALAIVLVAATLLIAALCWVWMRGSRASQARFEQQQREMVELLREQNELLKKISGERRP